MCFFFHIYDLLDLDGDISPTAVSTGSEPLPSHGDPWSSSSPQAAHVEVEVCVSCVLVWSAGINGLSSP